MKSLAYLHSMSLRHTQGASGRIVTTYRCDGTTFRTMTNAVNTMIAPTRTLIARLRKRGRTLAKSLEDALPADCCGCMATHGATHVFYPCGHQTICESCYKLWKEAHDTCPICRDPFIGAVRVYKS